MWIYFIRTVFLHNFSKTHCVETYYYVTYLPISSNRGDAAACVCQILCVVEERFWESFFIVAFMYLCTETKCIRGDTEIFCTVGLNQPYWACWSSLKILRNLFGSPLNHHKRGATSDLSTGCLSTDPTKV